MRRFDIFDIHIHILRWNFHCRQFINRPELHCRLRKHLIFSVLSFSVAANWYLRFPYLHFPSLQIHTCVCSSCIFHPQEIAQFHTSHFHTCVFQYLRFQHVERDIVLCFVCLFVPHLVNQHIDNLFSLWAASIDKHIASLAARQTVLFS